MAADNTPETTTAEPGETTVQTGAGQPVRSGETTEHPAADHPQPVLAGEADATTDAARDASRAEDSTDSAEGDGAPSFSFDPSNPFAVPEDLIPTLTASERRRRDRAEDAGRDERDDQDEDETSESGRGRRRRRSRGRGTRSERGDSRTEGEGEDADSEDSEDRKPGEDRASGTTSRRRRKRRRGSVDMELDGGEDGDPENTVTRVRAPRQVSSTAADAVQGVKGSTRLEAKRQRRRDSRAGGRRRQVITEAEFLARRESVDRKMLVRQRDKRIQIAVLEDGVLAEHFVSHTTQDSMIGNVYLGKVQNVLPSMEAAFVDIGRGRNAVLYAGEVDWSAANLDGKPKKIENALKSGDTVLVQVTKDPVGHKGARLTSQVSLPGRYLVYVPGGSMTGISRKLPDVERSRLKKILKDHLPQDAGVIVRTAAEGTSEQELQNDINRLRAQWEGIQSKAKGTKVLAPELLYAEPDLTIKTVRDVFNEDFSAMLVQGQETWDNIEAYVMYVAPHLLDRLHHWVPQDHDGEDLYATHRIDEQLHKALERKVYLPSGGSLVIDRTEAMTVVDVNTGKFTGSGGNLEETVTKNNLEAAEEIVRQLRLRDIGGIIVIDFIDMVLESNRDLVLRRMVECLGRDRTKHQVAEVTSLGLVQMTRKRMGTGLVEVFSETCEHCAGRGLLIQDEPVDRNRSHNPHGEPRGEGEGRRRRKKRGGNGGGQAPDAQAQFKDAEAATEAETSEEERLRQERAAAARAALQSIAKASGKAGDDDGAGSSEDRASASAGSDTEPSGSDGKDGSGEEQSSGRSRRKRRGKRRRGRGGEGRGEGQDQNQNGADSGDAGSSAADRGEAGRDGEGRDGRDRNGRHRADAEGPQAGRHDAETAADDRGGQDRSARAVEERSAGAEEDRSGRRRGGGRRAEADQAPAAEDASAEAGEDGGVITFDGEPVSVPRRRGARRASSAEGAKDLSALEDALEQKAATRRGVPRRAASSDAPVQASAGEDRNDTTPTSSDAPSEASGQAESAPHRRRPRRAASSGSAGSEVSAVEAPKAAEGSTFTASVGAPAATEEGAAPVVLGVGVKAADIVRHS
ncbi:Rne/Rng family ribonuclease [Micrococcus luteus]